MNGFEASYAVTLSAGSLPYAAARTAHRARYGAPDDVRPHPRTFLPKAYPSAPKECTVGTNVTETEIAALFPGLSAQVADRLLDLLLPRNLTQQRNEDEAA